MNDAEKFRKFVEATNGIAFWSRELLKVIEKPDNKRCQKAEPRRADAVGKQNVKSQGQAYWGF